MPQVSIIVYFAAPDRAAHAEQWICEITESVGFAFDTGTRKWEGTFFTAGGKYVISQVGSTDEYEIKELGKDSGGRCKGGFNEYGWLGDCDSFGLQYRFNRTSNEFMVVHVVGCRA